VRDTTIACIDVGTTGCRTILYTTGGKIITQAYQEYSHIYLAPTWIEHDPNAWLEAVRSTLTHVANSLPENEREFAAIAITSKRSTFIPVDKNGNALANAILWQDKRSIPQSEMIRKKVGPEYIYKKTGLRIDPYFSLPRILWIKENQPDLYQKMDKILTVHDFIIHFLTGKMITDWTQASRTMLFNINSLVWDDDICKQFDIRREILADLVPPGTIVGELKPELQREFGLRSEMPVIAVGGDQHAAAVGMGVISSGFVGVNSGTGSFILTHTDKPYFDHKQRIICTAAAIPGAWLMEASIITTGAIYRWFRDSFINFGDYKTADEKSNHYARLNQEAEKSPPGSKGLLMIPHFAGAAAPYWNPDASGIFFGLSLGHNRGDVIRSIFEGIAFEIYSNIRIMEEIHGTLNEIIISGGMSRSDLFNQIQANITGKSVRYRQINESTALGALIVAAVNVNLYSDINSACQRVLSGYSVQKNYPDNDRHSMYEKIYQLREQIYNRINSNQIYQKMKEINQQRHT
jgi:xylulokinase/glycerol kinase